MTETDARFDEVCKSLAPYEQHLAPQTFRVSKAIPLGDDLVELARRLAEKYGPGISIERGAGIAHVQIDVAFPPGTYAAFLATGKMPDFTRTTQFENGRPRV